MNILTEAISRRILDHFDAAVGGSRVRGRPILGGGQINRVAAAGILRLALRWPALSVIVVVSVIAARLLARRPGQTGEGPRALRRTNLN